MARIFFPPGNKKFEELSHTKHYIWLMLFKVRRVKGMATEPGSLYFMFLAPHPPPFRRFWIRYCKSCSLPRNYRTKMFSFDGPGLAQLIERLTHRYFESTSSNPGNLTSTTVCGDRTGGVPDTKRSAHVWGGSKAEVDLGECRSTLHSPPQKRIKLDPLCLWNPEETSPETQNRGKSGPQKAHVYVSPKTLKKDVFSCSWTSAKDRPVKKLWPSTITIVLRLK